MKKGRIFSGMRPTGRLHLGNLMGALANWVKLQDDYECFYAVVDWHALTTGYEDTSMLRQNVREVVMDYVAAGVDPERSTVFRQSDVKEHAELHLLLSMITSLGWLERCPTYKEQLQQLSGRDITTYGFLGYPVLMAADILAYRASSVPVGEDQLPHLELAREIARRFNYLYGTVFPEPQAILNDVPVLLGTDGRKMSKRYGNTIQIASTPQEVRTAVQSMITDPARIKKDRPRPSRGVHSVRVHYKAFAPELAAVRENECRNAEIGCVACKRQLADVIIDYLTPVWERRRTLETDGPSTIYWIAARQGQVGGGRNPCRSARSNEDMKVEAAGFSGPLDLLLTLIERREIDICQVSIAQIADDYLEHVLSMEWLDIDEAAEFLVLAATLLYIKVRALLPENERDHEALELSADGADEPDPGELLVARLIEYRRFRDAARALRPLEAVGLRAYRRPEQALPKPSPASRPPVGLDAASLVRAHAGDVEPASGVRPHSPRRNSHSQTDGGHPGGAVPPGKLRAAGSGGRGPVQGPRHHAPGHAGTGAARQGNCHTACALRRHIVLPRADEKPEVENDVP